VGTVKDGWKKADEHLTTLMDQEHIITLEDTEATVKRCERHLHRAATEDASPKAKVLATEISGQDSVAELAALKATTKAQDAKIKALSAQLRGGTSGAKRARNGVPVEKKPIPVERNLSQCEHCVWHNGSTMLGIVGINWTRTKPRTTVY
jgi:hypothetical protein